VNNLLIVWAPDFTPLVPREFNDPEFFASLSWTVMEGGGHSVTTPLRPGRIYMFGPAAVHLVISQPEVEGMEQVPLEVDPPVEPEPKSKRFRRQ